MIAKVRDLLDRQLGRVTMYRLVTIVLSVLAAIYVLFSATGVIDGVSVKHELLSLAVLLVVSYGSNRIFAASWQRTWNILLLALSAIQILRGLSGDGPLALALEFTAALQVSRLYNRRRAPEHQQIAILAFLHLCAATVLSRSAARWLSRAQRRTVP